jgi:hypothetical protein
MSRFKIPFVKYLDTIYRHDIVVCKLQYTQSPSELSNLLSAIENQGLKLS